MCITTHVVKGKIENWCVNKENLKLMVLGTMLEKYTWQRIHRAGDAEHRRRTMATTPQHNEWTNENELIDVSEELVV